MKELRSGRNAASQPVNGQSKNGENNSNSDGVNRNSVVNSSGIKRSSPVPGETSELRRSKRARAAVYNELVLARKAYSDAAEERDSVKKLSPNPNIKRLKGDSDNDEDTHTPTQRTRKWISKNNVKSKVNNDGEGDVSSETGQKISQRKCAKNKKFEDKDDFEEKKEDKGKDNIDGKIEIDDSDDYDDDHDMPNHNQNSLLDKSFSRKLSNSKGSTNKFLALMKKAAVRDSDEESRESDDNTMNDEVVEPSKANSKSQLKAHTQPRISQKHDSPSQNVVLKLSQKTSSKEKTNTASTSSSKSASKMTSKPTSKPASLSQKSHTITKTNLSADDSNSSNNNNCAKPSKPSKVQRKSKSLPDSSTFEPDTEILRQNSHASGRHKRLNQSEINNTEVPLIHNNNVDNDKRIVEGSDEKPETGETCREATNSDSDEFISVLSKSARQQRQQQKSLSVKEDVVGFSKQVAVPATIKIERSPEIGALQQVQADLEAAAQATDSTYGADRMFCAGVLNRPVAGLNKLASIQITQSHESFSNSSSKSSKHCPTVIALHPSLAAKLVCVGNARGTVTFVGIGAGGSATVGSKLRLHGKLPVSNILIHPDNPAQVVTAGWDGTIATFDLAAPKTSSSSIVSVDSHSLHDKLITKVVFESIIGGDTGANSLHYATLSGIYGHVDLRAPANTNRPIKLQSHDARAPLLDLAVRPDHANHVATATADGAIKLWDTRYFHQDTYFASFSANADGMEDGAGGATLLTALDWSPAGLLAGVVDSEAGEQGALVFDRTLQHVIASSDTSGYVRRLRYDAAYFSPIVNTAFAPPTYLLGSGVLARDDGAARIVAAYGSALLSPVARFQMRPLDGLCKFAVLGNSTSLASNVGVGMSKQNNIVLLDNRANILQTLELGVREPADDIALVEIHPLLNWTACITRNNKLHIWG